MNASHWNGATGIGALLLLCLSAGCIDDLPEQWQLTDTRLLAARYAPADDSSPAWATPGETGTLSFFVEEPAERPSRVTWGFVLCTGVLAPTGELICSDQVFQTEIEMTPQDSVPAFSVTVPATVASSVSHMGVLGVICSAPMGEPTPVPTFDTELGFESCTPEVDTNRFQFAVPLGESPRNSHPRLGVGGVSLIGVAEPWQEPVGDVDCGRVDPTRPTVLAGAPDVPLQLRAVDGSRETLPSGDLEALVFGHATTAGELERFFTVVETEAGAPDQNGPATVVWTPPTVEEATLVRFAFTVSDERAGSAWATRELCVVP